MASTITISCGTQKKTFSINLSKDNLQKSFSYYSTVSSKQKQLFNFSQNEYKTTDSNLYNKLCNALSSLMSLGGNKATIDDDDFKKAPLNSQTCKDNVWHTDDSEDITAIDYHTDNKKTFFHIG